MVAKKLISIIFLVLVVGSLVVTTAEDSKVADEKTSKGPNGAEVNEQKPVVIDYDRMTLRNDPKSSEFDIDVINGERVKSLRNGIYTTESGKQYQKPPSPVTSQSKAAASSDKTTDTEKKNLLGTTSTTTSYKFDLGKTTDTTQYYWVLDVVGDGEVVQRVYETKKASIPAEAVELEPEQYQEIAKLRKQSYTVNVEELNGKTGSVSAQKQVSQKDAYEIQKVSLDYSNNQLIKTETTSLTQSKIDMNEKASIEVKYKWNADSGKFEPQTTIIKGLDANGKDLQLTNIFNSKEWDIDKAGHIQYDGKTIKDYNEDQKMVEFQDGTFVREISKDTIIRKDANGDYTVDYKDGGSVVVSKEIIGDDMDQALPVIERMGEISKIAENNRRDMDTAKREGNKIILEDGSTITVKEISWEDSNGVEKKEAGITYSNEDTTITYVEINGNLEIRKTKVGDTEVTYDIEGDRIQVGNTWYERDRSFGENVLVYEYNGKYINPITGDAYTEDKDGNLQDCEDCKELEKSLKENAEAKRVASGGPNNRELRAIKIFDWLETSQTGFGKLFSLFIDDETLAEWRQGVDDFFCSTVLFGGRDCWVSEVCGEYTDKAGGPGTLLIETPSGMLDATAHVEGERQELFYRDEGETKGEYLYKISFGVRTPDNYGDDIKFNVRIEGERTLMLYNEWIEVDEGDTFSKAGKKVLVEYSDYRYDRICIVFEGKIRKRKGEFIDELCNAIVPLAGEYYTILPSQNRMDEVDI